MTKLIINPKSSLQDEKVCIKAIGLIPLKSYTFTSHLQDAKKNNYFAYAHYIANSHGVIDLHEDASTGGHYTGVFQMGLIAALQPAFGEYKYSRLFKRDVEVPNEIEIRLFEGSIEPNEIFSYGQPILAKDLHYRHFMGPGVKRIPVRDGNIRGTLFIPAGDGPFPAVVDMFGTAGGLLEYRSAQLASRGIVSLALAFFNYLDLPQSLRYFELSYFEEAVHFLLRHEKVLKPHVGVVGVSKGGDLALTMGAFIPEVFVSVSISGSCSVLGGPTKINDHHVIPSLPHDVRRARLLNNHIVQWKHATLKPEDFQETIIPIHKSNSKYLFIVGEDDQNLDCQRFAKIAAKNLDFAGKTNDYEIHSYKNAGHLIEPPYSAFCPASYHSVFGFVFAWGGDVKAHTEAQEDAWVQLLTFIKKHLQTTKSKL